MAVDLNMNILVDDDFKTMPRNRFRCRLSYGPSVNTGNDPWGPLLNRNPNFLIAVFGFALALALVAPLPASAGTWIKDSSNGCAVWNPFSDPNMTITWSGPCPGGRASGRGTLQWFKGGRLKVRQKGGWQNGKPHGRGVEIAANGNRYEGEWRDGKKHGRGVLTWADGNRYEGDFRNDKEHGRGMYTYADGRRCVSEFLDGKPTSEPVCF